MNFLFLIQILVLAFLIYLSYLDLKTNEISNWLLVLFFVFSLALVLISWKPVLLLMMGFIFVVGLLLWKFKAFGGADVKLLPSLIPFMLIDTPNILVGMWFYLVILLLIGVSFGILCKFILKAKEVPFIPAITLSYIVFEIFKLLWLHNI